MFESEELSPLVVKSAGLAQQVGQIVMHKDTIETEVGSHNEKKVKTPKKLMIDKATQKTLIKVY